MWWDLWGRDVKLKVINGCWEAFDNAFIRQDDYVEKIDEKSI